MELFNTILPTHPKNLYHNSLFPNAGIQDKTQKWQNLKQKDRWCRHLSCSPSIYLLHLLILLVFLPAKLICFAILPSAGICSTNLDCFRTNHAQFILKIKVSVPKDLRTHLHCLQSAGKLTFLISLSLPTLPFCVTAAFFVGTHRNSCPTTTHIALQCLHIPWAFPLYFMASPSPSPAFPQPTFSGDNKTLTARLWAPDWAPSSCQRMWERGQSRCRS